jgi:hypothetical protein
MSWETELADITYVMLGDFDKSVYAEENIEKLRMVINELNFSYDYVASMEDMDITPDPTDADYRDDSFINLTCLKACCIMAKGDAIQKSGKPLVVRDIGGITVDTREVFKAKLAILEKGWCKTYEEEKLQYQAGQTRVAGAAVLSPFRTCAGWATIQSN